MKHLNAVTSPTTPPDGRSLDILVAKERRLFVGQLRRLLAEAMARFQCAALSLSLSSGQDLACAFCDRDGRIVAEVGEDPILCGSLGAQVAAVMAAIPRPAAEAIVIANDPFPSLSYPGTSAMGGLDTSTFTMVAPLYDATFELCGYLALRARHPVPPFGAADPSAELPRAPGDELLALPPAIGPRYADFQAERPAAALPRTIDQEGTRLPPTLLSDSLLRELCRGARTPRDRFGDLLAQRSALRYGLARLRELLFELGEARLRSLCSAVVHDGEESVRAALAKLPSGVYAFADSLDGDGAGRSDIGIRVTCRVQGGHLQLDLTETDDAVPGPLNTVRPVVVAVVRHALRQLLPVDAVPNDGWLAPVVIRLRPGSLLAAQPPAALALGAEETAWRLYEVILGAFAQAAPSKVTAAGCGTMSSVFLVGPGLLHRERLPGGRGGGPPGALGERPSATATVARFGGRSISAELLERRLPVRILGHGVRLGAGGGGIYPGSDGEVREIELLAHAEVTIASERRRRPPYGLAGGGPGAVGRDSLLRKTTDAQEERSALLLPEKVCFAACAGDRLRIEAPGGGGHGDPQRAAFFAALLT